MMKVIKGFAVAIMASVVLSGCSIKSLSDVSLDSVVEMLGEIGYSNSGQDAESIAVAASRVEGIHSASVAYNAAENRNTLAIRISPGWAILGHERIISYALETAWSLKETSPDSVLVSIHGGFDPDYDWQGALYRVIGIQALNTGAVAVTKNEVEFVVGEAVLRDKYGEPATRQTKTPRHSLTSASIPQYKPIPVKNLALTFEDGESKAVVVADRNRVLDQRFEGTVKLTLVQNGAVVSSLDIAADAAIEGELLLTGDPDSPYELVVSFEAVEGWKTASQSYSFIVSDMAR